MDKNEASLSRKLGMEVEKSVIEIAQRIFFDFGIIWLLAEVEPVLSF